MTAYNELEARFRRLGAVEEAIAMLHWDAAATMPSGGAGARTEQLATLRGIAHRLLAAPEIGDLLEAAETQIAALGPWQRANVREMRRRWRHAAALPDDLVETLSRARSESEIVWRAARPANDFAMALPGLERVLDLTREVALAKAEALDTSPYEALLDQYEPDLSTSTIDTLFGKIAGFVPALLEAAL
ncbi:MAG: carboxypeptidase M32, partial [Alphaproteobacteria bacterium]|nr:carboxypeptidase M32 [Alphaproteobacteria bacterium]